jgi:hypothetical protein
MSNNRRTLMLAGTLIAMAMSVAVPQASAKCTITLKFTNNNANAIEVLGSESQSRVNGGLWSKMNFQNVTIQPGQTGSTSWKTNMSCNGNALRDLRIKYRDLGDNVKYQENYNDHDFDDGDTVTIPLEH